MLTEWLYISQQSMDWDIIGVVRMSTPPMVVDRKQMLQKGAVSFDVSTYEDTMYDVSGFA